MSKSTITVEEAIGLCKNTSIPTILAEGKDDYIAYRRLEKKLRHINVDVLFLGGRENVLRVFERRHEINNAMVAYIVDKDLWLFKPIPQEYIHDSLIMTDGYSIENDMYRDGCLEELMDEDELRKFSRDCGELLKWYSFAIFEYISNRTTEIDVHIDRVVDKSGNLVNEFLDKVKYNGYRHNIYDELKINYRRLVRGKTLFSLLLRYLAYTGRPAKHRSDSLLDHASTRNGPHFQALQKHIEALFS